MSQTLAPEKPPLDEVMLAMDVVDTLRHRELIVQRELSADERDSQLIARLREIYAGQGIVVSDAVLERGVRDLRENRFTFTPPGPSMGRTLARIYVSRRRWVPPLVFVTGIVAAVALGWQLLVRGPQLAAIDSLPTDLERSYAAVVELAQESAVDAQAADLRVDGERALAREDYGGARTVIAELDELNAVLQQEYELHVVSRPGQLSGVWRVPDDNPNAQNYYLIVEAIGPGGDRLTLPIRNEEDGRTVRVSQWGQRVEAARFRATAADKQDDGIIQDDVIASKRRGILQPELRPGVLAGAITDW
jgi:hypothetical protein